MIDFDLYFEILSSEPTEAMHISASSWRLIANLLIRKVRHAQANS